jgi:hypothetical protein
MRDAEDSIMEYELNLVDAWKAAGSDPLTRYTWDMVDHVESVSAARAIFVFVGDTNMRDAEDSIMEYEWNLVDAWKAAGSDPLTRYTWDMVDHVESVSAARAGWQNRYYGPKTRQYVRRYDRLYIQSIRHANVVVRSFGVVVANQPIPPSNFIFLSDHFGVAADLAFVWEDK